MKLEERIYNGNRAREVLENEVFQQVMTDLKAEITEKWQTSPARDEKGREWLWMLLSAAKKLEFMLQTTLDTGKLATADLEHQRTLAERAKAYLGME